MSAKRPIILESGEQRLLEPEEKIVGHVTEQEMTQALATKLDASALPEYPKITVTDTPPTSSDGEDGDIWFVI